MKNRTLAESAGFTSRRPVLVPQVDHSTSSDHPWSLVLRGGGNCPTITIGGLSRLGPTGSNGYSRKEQVVLRVHPLTNGSLRDLQKENRNV